jgi:RNA polymerase sigma factor (sigma-70 family)
VASILNRSSSIVTFNTDASGRPNHWFATTRWSLVAAAGDVASPTVSQALEELCRSYWQPLYWHVRRLGHQPAVAQDLTQAFFAHVLEKRLINSADQQRGKFRTFLLTALRNFLANQHEWEQALKRGGGRVFPMDFQSAETAYQLESTRQSAPEQAFERQWAVAVLEEAFVTLGREQHAAGKGPLFEALAPCLTARDDAPRYAELAEQLGLSPAAVRKSVGRLRAHYARSIREEVARTISEHENIDEEIKSLFRALQLR